MKKMSTNPRKRITAILFVLAMGIIIAVCTGCSNTKENPNGVAKPEIQVNLHDVVAYYGEGPVPVDFDYDIKTKGFEISKDELSKKFTTTRQPGLEVGKYAITGENKDPNLDIKFNEATYEIRKASYDMSDIKFPDKQVAYNGKPQWLQIEGILQDGVTVEYDNNGNSSIGEHLVTARFIVDSKRYEEIPNMYATLTIVDSSATGKVQNTVATSQGTKKTTGTTSTSTSVQSPVSDKETDEKNEDSGNGNSSDPITELPKPSVIVYICDRESVFGEPLEELDFSPLNMNGNPVQKEDLKNMIRLIKEPGNDAGEYKITGEFIGNSDEIDVKIFDGKYIIKKGTYYEAMSKVSFTDRTVKADGQEYSLEITGDLPDGVTVEYLNNGHREPGSYVVTAIFTGDTKNYEPIPNKKAVLTITGASNSSNHHGGSATEGPQEPVNPDVPDTPDLPKEPVTPEEPTIPAPPVVPDTPDVPNVPSTPEVPTEPAPTEPEPTEPEPTEPAPPVVPDTPDVPKVPSTPEVPTEPVPTEPAPPVVLDTPDVPNVPSTSEEPTKEEPTVVLAIFHLFTRNSILDN